MDVAGLLVPASRIAEHAASTVRHMTMSKLSRTVNPATTRWNYEVRLLAGALLVAAPALVALAIVLVDDRASPAHALWVWLPVALLTLALAAELRRRAIYPLRTLSNLLEALREGDYSLRGSRAQRGDAIGEVVIEINALSRTLREQRLAVEEKSALLAKVIAVLDNAVFAFDHRG
ncbi:MAG: hypothetical protein ABI650_07760, partial [Dokdonella sp.]